MDARCGTRGRFSVTRRQRSPSKKTPRRDSVLRFRHRRAVHPCCTFPAGSNDGQPSIPASSVCRVKSFPTAADLARKRKLLSVVKRRRSVRDPIAPQARRHRTCDAARYDRAARQAGCAVSLAPSGWPLIGAADSNGAAGPLSGRLVKPKRPPRRKRLSLSETPIGLARETESRDASVS
jgi:hypothetical protein